MSILVTGGTGYIGSHTVVELLNSGDFERHINRERRARRKALNSSAPH